MLSEGAVAMVERRTQYTATVESRAERGVVGANVCVI